eukprot:TRINITY_DN2494_c0_g1_i3.p1 TRINITY_DN2494_c0_g1~~TRINITY_DN2494_c0_g1_i3.p1  ORF type:complete len:145 (-),score=5.34 TRINITY_DN2494_c0_g1_i3:68-502(-)
MSEHQYDIKKPQWLISIILFFIGFIIALAGLSVLEDIRLGGSDDSPYHLYWYSLFWSLVLVVALVITSIMGRHMAHVLLGLFAAEVAISTIVTSDFLSGVQGGSSGKTHSGISCGFAGFLIKTLSEMLILVFLGLTMSPDATKK